MQVKCNFLKVNKLNTNPPKATFYCKLQCFLHLRTCLKTPQKSANQNLELSPPPPPELPPGQQLKAIFIAFRHQLGPPPKSPPPPPPPPPQNLPFPSSVILPSATALSVHIGLSPSCWPGLQSSGPHSLQSLPWGFKVLRNSKARSTNRLQHLHHLQSMALIRQSLSIDSVQLPLRLINREKNTNPVEPHRIHQCHPHPYPNLSIWSLRHVGQLHIRARTRSHRARGGV